MGEVKEVRVGCSAQSRRVRRRIQVWSLSQKVEEVARQHERRAGAFDVRLGMCYFTSTPTLTLVSTLFLFPSRL
jgi:hypothetical protein